jgi:transmembrane sensor
MLNIDEYTSWKDGRLTFRSESLETLAPKLERFYNVNITFLDDSIKTLRYTGTLRR